MPKFITTIEVDALQWTKDNTNQVLNFCSLLIDNDKENSVIWFDALNHANRKVYIKTRQQLYIGEPWDYIVKDANDAFCIVPLKIFQEKYVLWQ